MSPNLALSLSLASFRQESLQTKLAVLTEDNATLTASLELATTQRDEHLRQATALTQQLHDQSAALEEARAAQVPRHTHTLQPTHQLPTPPMELLFPLLHRGS